MLIAHAPGSLTTWAPRTSPACRSANTAPCGSATTATRAPPAASNGSARTVPPAALTLRAVSPASSTQMCVIHSAASGAEASEAMPIIAASRPRRRHSRWASPSGSASQPSSSP